MSKITIRQMQEFWIMVNDGRMTKRRFQGLLEKPGALRFSSAVMYKMLQQRFSFLQCLAELVKNAADAGAQSVKIRFFEDEHEDKCVQVIDDGGGICKTAQLILARLFEEMKIDRSSVDTHGHLGIGGYLSPLSNCNMFRYHFKTDAGECHLDLSWSHLHGDSEHPLVWSYGPFTNTEDHHMMTENGTQVTLFDIEDESEEPEDRSPAWVVDQLATHLSKRVAGIVTIIGYDNQTSPLRPY